MGSNASVDYQELRHFSWQMVGHTLRSLVRGNHLNFFLSKSTMLLSSNHRVVTSERLQNETLFLEPWFDATLILVDAAEEEDVNYLSFADPFDKYMWLAIGVTCVFSAFFLMFLEKKDEKFDKSQELQTWVSDSLYRSFLAIAQKFPYGDPGSPPRRIFIMTFGLWTMLIGRSYTAGLASLLVEQALTSPISSVEAAMKAELPICIHAGSASESIIQTLYPRFADYNQVVKRGTVSEMYTSLYQDECEILVGTYQEFEVFKSQKKYGCSLVQAGPKLHLGVGSFGVTFDPANCRSVLAYVLDVHLHKSAEDGDMDRAWKQYIQDLPGSCESHDNEENRRLLRDEQKGKVSEPELHRRNLKSAPRREFGAVDKPAGTEKGNATIRSLAGVFVLHACGTSIALVWAVYLFVVNNSKDTKDEGKGDDDDLKKEELLERYMELKGDLEILRAKHLRGIEETSSA